MQATEWPTGFGADSLAGALPSKKVGRTVRSFGTGENLETKSPGETVSTYVWEHTKAIKADNVTGGQFAGYFGH